MFEVGRDYEIHWIEHGEEGPGEVYSTFHVVAWEAPLLKTKGHNSELVHNVASMFFIRAEKVLREEEKEPPPEIWITPVDGDGTPGESFKLGG